MYFNDNVCIRIIPGCHRVPYCCRLVKRDDILQINFIYFSPHHKNKFVNGVNSLAALAETKKANMLDFTRSGLPNVSQSKSRCRFFVIAIGSLFTQMHLSLDMFIRHTYNYN